MDLEGPVALSCSVLCYDDCECTPLENQSNSDDWLCSVKQRLDELEEGDGVIIPGSNLLHAARVEIGNECNALRDMVTCQQNTIQDLSLELEEERNASMSAANETMSMMLRLQREKAEIQMEFRQFKRYAEEKMAHDSQELSVLEDLLYKREIAIESLYFEVQAYKSKMKSFGLLELEADGEEWCAISCNDGEGTSIAADCKIEAFNYPPLRCSLNETLVNAEGDNNVIDIDKYALGDTPHSRKHLRDLECRLNQLENSPRQYLLDEELTGLDSVWEKVREGRSPEKPGHFRRSSTDSSKSITLIVQECSSDVKSLRFSNSLKKELPRSEEYSKSRMFNNGSEIGDDMSERVCMIDSVDQVIGCDSDVLNTQRGPLEGADIEDPEIQKLYMRLQALEADRDSMRKALNSMVTDKAQVVLLKEIAEHLCKDMSPARRMPTRKPTLFASFSFLSVFKWMVSFFWRMKAHQCKYMFEMSARNAGLLMLIEKGPRVGRWRCLFSTQVLSTGPVCAPHAVCTKKPAVIEETASRSNYYP